MSADPLGPQVLAAVKFIQHIHRDLAMLVQHADKVLAENGWKPTVRNNVFGRMGNRLNPKAWVLTRLYRCYTQNSDAFVLIPILDPPGAYTEPICIGCIVNLSRALAPASLTKKRKWLRSLVNQIEGKEGEFDLPVDEARRLFQHAMRIRGLVVRLCELTCEGDLVEKFIAPVLKVST